MSKVERFAGGAIGEPGSRVFMLELVIDGVAVAYVLEKLQVAALAEEAQRLLRERGMVGAGLSLDPGGDHDETPVPFSVGGMELTLADDADEAKIALFSTEDEDLPFTFEVTVAQLDAFAREAKAAVESGRPACPRCGLAMDPEGHNCPRTNGDLRGHRP